MSFIQQLELGKTRQGRILIHLISMNQNWRVWLHLKGILREYGYCRPYPRNAPAHARLA